MSSPAQDLNRPTPDSNANQLSLSGWLRNRAGDGWRKRWLNERPSVAVQAAIEPVESRDYCTGDDLARVDWNRCARLDELVVRQYFGNELQALDIWIDHSPSIDFDGGSKLSWAKRFASLLAVQALNEGETVSAYAVSAAATPIGKSIRGRAALASWLPNLDASSAASQPLRLAEAAASYLKLRRASATLLILTDLFDPAESQLVQALRLLNAAGVSVCLLQMHTDEEVNPQAGGRCELQDVENQESLTTTLRESDLAAYRQEVSLYLQGIRRVCHRAGALWARVSVDDSFDDVLSVLSRTSQIGRAL